mgnify:CR=1 FL=1
MLFALPVSMPAWAADEMQVFAIRDDGQLWDTYWDGEAWHEWHAHGGELVGNPAACSWGADRIDVFARGRDGALHLITGVPRLRPGLRRGTGGY